MGYIGRYKAPSIVDLESPVSVDGTTIIENGVLKNVGIDGIKLKSSGDSVTKSDGTTAVLSESGGVVTLGNSVVGSIQGFELYQLASNITQNSTITGFTLKNSGTFGVKGNLIEESSGIITFNSTGIYLLQGSFHITTSLTTNDTVIVYTHTCTDGSTFSTVGNENHRDQASVNSNGPSHNKIPVFTILNCTDTSLVKLIYVADSISAGTSIQAGSLSTIIVMKIG